MNPEYAYEAVVAHISPNGGVESSSAGYYASAKAAWDAASGGTAPQYSLIIRRRVLEGDRDYVQPEEVIK